MPPPDFTFDAVPDLELGGVIGDLNGLLKLKADAHREAMEAIEHGNNPGTGHNNSWKQDRGLGSY